MQNRRLNPDLTGLTLVETVVALSLVSVTGLAIAAFLADNHRAYNQVYRSAFCPAAEEQTAARVAFQRVIRQASSAAGRTTVASDDSWLEVQYCSDPSVSAPDRTARFYVSEEELRLERSALDTQQSLSVETVCRHVASATFHLTGTAAQMFLELDDGSSTRVVNMSAVMRSP